MNICDIYITQEYRMRRDTRWMKSGYKSRATIVDINLELGEVKYKKDSTGQFYTQGASKFLSSYVPIIILDGTRQDKPLGDSQRPQPLKEEKGLQPAKNPPRMPQVKPPISEYLNGQNMSEQEKMILKKAKAGAGLARAKMLIVDARRSGTDKIFQSRVATTIPTPPRPPISEIYAPDDAKIEDTAFNKIFFTPIFNCIHLIAAFVVVTCLFVAQ
jgi:hypothetical protein